MTTRSGFDTRGCTRELAEPKRSCLRPMFGATTPSSSTRRPHRLTVSSRMPSKCQTSESPTLDPPWKCSYRLSILTGGGVDSVIATRNRFHGVSRMLTGGDIRHEKEHTARVTAALYPTLFAGNHRLYTRRAMLLCRPFVHVLVGLDMAYMIDTFVRGGNAKSFGHTNMHADEAKRTLIDGCCNFLVMRCSPRDGQTAHYQVHC